MAFQDFYSKLSDNEKKIFCIAVVVVSLMVLDRVFLGPVLNRIRMLDKKIQEQKSIVAQDLRFLAYRDRILKDNEDLRDYYGDPSKTVEEIIASFLKTIEMMASQSKVNLIKVSPSDFQQKKGYAEYYANLECEGLFNDVISFMHRIDTSEDLLKINTIDMSLKRASGDEVLVGMVVAKMIVDSSVEDAPVQAITSRLPESQGELFGTAGGSESVTRPDEKASAQGVGDRGSTLDHKTASQDAGFRGSARPSDDRATTGPSARPGPEVSQRIEMTGLDKMKFIPQDTGEEAEELKPSLFEVLMQRFEKDSEGR